MSELSKREIETLEKRRQGFGSFVQEIGPVLEDFADRLGLQNPSRIVTNPEEYVDPIGDFMRDQVINEEDRSWIAARMCYFIGQILIYRLGGEWLLNENPASRFFLRYVIGRMPGVRKENTTVDPFAITADYLARPPGRNLSQIIAEAQAEVQMYWDDLGSS